MSVIAAKLLASARLLVQDPRAHEAMTTAGARFDWHFREPDEWLLDDCEIITGSDERNNGPTAKVGFLTLRHTCEPEDMELDHWTYSHYSGDWLLVRPTEMATRWIHQANTGWTTSDVNDYPHVYATSAATWGDQTGAVAVWLRTFEPATPGAVANQSTGEGQSIWQGNYPHVHVQFGNSPAWTGSYYMMLFPEGTGGQHPILAYHHAGLECETCDGSGSVGGETCTTCGGEGTIYETTWTLVHEFRDAQTQGVDKNFSVRPIWLTQSNGAIEFSGYVVFDWEAGQGEQTVLYLPDWPCDPNPYIRVGGRAMMWAWCLGTPQYVAKGTATCASTFSVPADVTAAYSESYVATEPTLGSDSTDVTVARLGAGTENAVRITLETHDPCLTPIVMRATLTHEPAYGSAVTTTVYDSAGVGAERLREVSWQQGTGWRGAGATCVVRDLEWALEFRANQVVTIQASHVGDALADQFYGRIVRARWKRQGDDGTCVGRVWTLECRDETARMAHKRRGHLYGSLAGMCLHEAALIACAYVGIHEDRLVAYTGGSWFQATALSAGATPYLPWSESAIGELTFARGVSLPGVLDRICELAGWEWGVNSGPGSVAGAMGGGDVCLWPKAGLRTYAAEDATCLFGTTAATATSVQHVMFGQEWSDDGDELANHVEVLGRDGLGRPVAAVARRVPAVTTSSDPYFVGDYWYESETADDDQNPAMRARARLAEVQDAREGCTWRGPAVPTLRPMAIIGVETEASTYRIMRLGPARHAIGKNRAWLVDYMAEAVMES